MTPEFTALTARASSLQRATIVETDLYTPQAIVPGDPNGALPVRAVAPGSALGEALATACAWSYEQQGVALIVMVGGEIVSEHYRAGAGPDIRLNSFSMHKSVLALAVLAACDDGVISSLDAPAGRYLEDWRDDARGSISIRQLMQMASGLELPSFTSRDPRALELVFGTDIDAAARQLRVIDAPGRSFAYNNANSQLAGHILSRALARAGQGSYPDYVSRRLWRPLGNRDATMWLDRPDGAPHYAMNLHATPRDWARVGELLRNFGRSNGMALISRDAFDALAAPSAANPGYGLHIWRGAPWEERRVYAPDAPMTAYHSAPFLADDVLYLDGFGGQRVYVVPSCGLTIVRMGTPNLAYDDAIIPNLLIAALHGNSPAE